MAEDNATPKWKITLQKIHENRGNFHIPVLMWNWKFPDGFGKVEIKAWPHLGTISFDMRRGKRFWPKSPFDSSDAILVALSISCSDFGKPSDPPHLNEVFGDVIASKPLFENGDELKKRQVMETLTAKWQKFVSK